MDKVQIKDFRTADLQIFLSDNLQLGDLLSQILSYLDGEIQMTLSTFSVGEEFLRKLLNLKKVYNITDITLYADIKAAEKTSKLNHFIRSSVTHFRLTKIHAKMLLVSNECYTVSVITSQNETRGNRLESYVICTDTHAFDNLRNHLAEQKYKEV